MLAKTNYMAERDGAMLSPAVERALLESELFSACVPGAVIHRTQAFEKGMRLPAALDGEASVGLIVQGRVSVYSLGLDGTAVGISTLRRGESFGISNIFTGEDLSTLLVGDGKTLVAYIPKSCFLDLLERTPGMMIRYATICNRKLRYLTEKIEFLAIPSCRARLAAYLLQNSVGGRVSPKCSKEQLAGILGVSRASLFRELRWLRTAGHIATEKTRITIQNPDALRSILENKTRVADSK